MSKEEAEKRHYCECSYCGGGLKGDFRVMKKAIRRWDKTQAYRSHMLKEQIQLILALKTGSGNSL